MAVKIIILIALMAGSAFAYDPVSSYSVTNNRELLNPEVSFTGQVGRLMRVTTYVQNGDTTPYDLGTNSVRAWITQADSGTNQTVTATIVSAANGIVQYQWSPSLDGSGSAKLVAYAMANTVTVAQIAEHYVTVTPAAQAQYTGSLIPLQDTVGYIGFPTLRWGGIYASTGTFDSLIISNLSVAGAISAVDTGAVKLVGSDMTGGLTNRTAAGFVGNGVNLTNLSGVVAVSSLAPLSNAVLQAVTNAGATINGSAISNGAAITVSAAGEVNSRFVSVTWLGNDLAYSAATWYHFWPTNYATAGLGEYDPSNSFSTNTGIYAPGTTGVFMVRCWNDELVGAAKTLSIGVYENENLVTNGCGSNAYSPSTGVGGGAVIGYNGDGSFALSGTQWTDNGAFGYFCSSVASNTYKIGFIPWQGSTPNLYRGHFTIVRVGSYP